MEVSVQGFQFENMHNIDIFEVTDKSKRIVMDIHSRNNDIINQ